MNGIPAFRAGGPGPIEGREKVCTAIYGGMGDVRLIGGGGVPRHIGQMHEYGHDAHRVGR